MRVIRMITNGGNKAVDQWVKFDEDNKQFYSYDSLVATIFYSEHLKTVLHNPFWDMYSQTTNNYLLKFLNEESITDIRKKVSSGDYLVV